MGKTTPLILLDRDGTLITEQDYLKDPRKVKLLPGVVAGLRRLSQTGWPLVVVSNQSGIGRGLMTRQDVARVQKRLDSLLRSRGIRLAGIYWCPHRPDAGCSCRKPKLKLVRQAAQDLGATWKRSISVGDKWSDVRLGQRTGGQGVLMLTGYGRHSLKQTPHEGKADFVAPNFQAAARWILKAAQKESETWIKRHRKA